MMYEYDKNFKFDLTDEDITNLLQDLGADPNNKGDGSIVSRTICHCGEHHKLWYWNNTHLFHCFSDCSDSFDVFELVRRVKSQEDNTEWPLPKAIQYVADYFGISGTEVMEEDEKLEDWRLLNKYDKIAEITYGKPTVDYKEVSAPFLKFLPRPEISTWTKEGITKEAMDTFGICYEPKLQSIVIPHYDKDNRLIGIRQRTMIEEVAAKYGKYRPLKEGKKMYNHQLSFNLYGLNLNKENIKRAKKAIVFESEKAVLQYESMFGRENNIAVAICGSSFGLYQAWLLMSLGVEEIIVGLDHDFTTVDSKEAKKVISKYKDLHNKYGKFVHLSFLWDRDGITPYKASAVDCGKDIFITLYKQRVSLY